MARSAVAAIFAASLNDALAWIMEGAEAEGLALNQTALATLKALSDPIAPLQPDPSPGWVDRFLYWRGP